MAAPVDEYQFASVLDLHKSEDASTLLRSHDSVVEYYRPLMEERERCSDFLRNEHWTDDEREVAKQKKKALVEFNKLKTSERTFVGNMIQQRYDIKPAPRTPTSQDKSDILTHMYHWTADVTDIRYKDPGLIRSSWVGGNAWQESYVEITPGRKPRIRVINQNNFGIYPDPNRRDLVHNSDCMFIDRVSWMSISELCDACPEKEEEIRKFLVEKTSISYEQDKAYADRAHEWKNYRNGKYKVVERFYRVFKKMWYGVGPQGRIDLGYDAQPEMRKAFQEDFPGHQLAMEREEFLYVAIVCPAMGPIYLRNTEYHCQPRDPITDRIIFPLVELVDEDLDGIPQGHVIHQIGPIKVLDSLMVNKLYAAKNAAGQSHTVSREHFDEDVLVDLMENHQDGARSFPKKAGAPPGPGVELIPQGKASIDADQSIEFLTNFVDEVSSTPPAMKGQSEGNVPGVLNEQRIQQSFVQCQVSINNYMNFLTRRARLWAYYWKEFWTFEDVIRVIEKKNTEDPTFLKINEIIRDQFGNVQRKNSLDDADAYDMTFEDSWKSPTVRDKVRQQITQLMSMQGTQQDPTLAAFLTNYFLTLSDAPQEMKDLVKQHAQAIAQQEQQKAQVEGQNAQLDQHAKLQEMADAEAQATTMLPPNAMPPGMQGRMAPQPSMAGA